MKARFFSCTECRDIKTNTKKNLSPVENLCARCYSFLSDLDVASGLREMVHTRPMFFADAYGANAHHRIVALSTECECMESPVAPRFTMTLANGDRFTVTVTRQKKGGRK